MKVVNTSPFDDDEVREIVTAAAKQAATFSYRGDTDLALVTVRGRKKTSRYWTWCAGEIALPKSASRKELALAAYSYILYFKYHRDSARKSPGLLNVDWLQNGDSALKLKPPPTKKAKPPLIRVRYEKTLRSLTLARSRIEKHRAAIDRLEMRVVKLERAQKRYEQVFSAEKGTRKLSNDSFAERMRRKRLGLLPGG